MDLTQARVRELFDYREDGFLVWKLKPAARVRIGSIAGSFKTEYAGVRVDGRPQKVHRVIFLWHHGYLPEEIDHADCDTKNNRISNLRPASRSNNCANRRIGKGNTSGLKGVYWYKRKSKWVASVRVDGKLIHLGYFEHIHEAHAAYVEAARKHHGVFARTD